MLQGHLIELLLLAPLGVSQHTLTVPLGYYRGLQKEDPGGGFGSLTVLGSSIQLLPFPSARQNTVREKKVRGLMQVLRGLAPALKVVGAKWASDVLQLDSHPIRCLKLVF